jgi:hypothetical protein
MLNTKDLAVRAEVCAGCHVGKHAPHGLLEQDVNHDLIAAGHPRLSFELSAFLDNMPAHWDERDENAGPVGPNHRAADFPARAWAVGQLATAKAALELLEARADRAQSALALLEKRPGEAEAVPELQPLAQPAMRVEKPTVLWPEFTEYGCFSCHHDLRDQAWRRRSQASGSIRGTPQWGSWTLPLPSELIAEFVPQSVAQTYAKSIEPLSTEMAKPVPDLKVVKREARAMADVFGRYLEPLASQRFDGPQIRRLIELFGGPDAWGRVANWDQATQLYLALAPLCQSWVALEPDRKADQGRLQARLKEIRGRLSFPTGYDSPRWFEPARLRSGP